MLWHGPWKAQQGWAFLTLQSVFPSFLPYGIRSSSYKRARRHTQTQTQTKLRALFISCIVFALSIAFTLVVFENGHHHRAPWYQGHHPFTWQTFARIPRRGRMEPQPFSGPREPANHEICWVFHKRLFQVHVEAKPPFKVDCELLQCVVEIDGYKIGALGMSPHAIRQGCYMICSGSRERTSDCVVVRRSMKFSSFTQGAFLITCQLTLIPTLQLCSS